MSMEKKTMFQKIYFTKQNCIESAINVRIEFKEFLQILKLNWIDKMVGPRTEFSTITKKRCRRERRTEACEKKKCKINWI